MLHVPMFLAQPVLAAGFWLAAAAPVLAQDAGGAEPLPTMVAEAFRLCWQASSSPDTLRLFGGAMGWDMDVEPPGPFVQIMYGTRDYEGFGEAFLVVTAERYPHRRLGFCQFQVDIPDSMIADVEAIRALETLRGMTQTRADGVFMVLEEDVDAPTVFVNANQTEGRLTIGVTRFTEITP